MMTISVGLDMTKVSPQRLQEILPFMTSVFAAQEIPAQDSPDAQRHVLVKRPIANRKAKAEALRMVEAIPEAILDLRPIDMGHGQLLTFAHGEANRKLSAALRRVRLSVNKLGIRLLPDSEKSPMAIPADEDTVLINGTPATQLQLDGFRVPLAQSGLQYAYQPLERHGLSLLVYAATQTEMYLRHKVGLDDMAIDELREALQKYDLDIGLTVKNWNLEKRLA